MRLRHPPPALGLTARQAPKDSVGHPPDASGPPLPAEFNGLRMTANEGMKLVAPPAGAGLYVRFGGPAVALLDAATCALAALLFARLPEREPPRPPAGARRGELAAGLRRIGGSPVLRPLVAAGAATMLVAGVNGAMDAVLGRTAATAGSLMTVPNAVALAAGAGLVAVVDARVIAAGGGAVGVVAAAVPARGVFVRPSAPVR